MTAGYLLDTNVVSALAPGRPGAPADLAAWLRVQGDRQRLYLSVVVVAEIERGLRKLERNGATLRSRAYRQWFLDIETVFSNFVLPIGLITARLAGEIGDRASANGHDPGFADVLIAATAQEHGLTVLTVNTRHFEPLTAAHFNPFEHLPPD